MDSLTERVAWAITTIKKDPALDRGISNINLGKKLGTNKDTLADYIKRRGLLKSEVVEKIVLIYKFNPLWLFSGKGEPFPGARLKYPDVCGPEEVSQETAGKKNALYNSEEPAALHVAKTRAEYIAGVDDFGKAVDGLREIFDSHDPVLIPAIQANIHIFQISVRREHHIQQQSDEITALKKENTNINTRLEAIEKRLAQTTEAENTEKKAI